MLARGRGGLAGLVGVLEPFSVVVVPFPFIDRNVTRRRPALVVSTAAFQARHQAVVLAMITSAVAGDWPSDVVLVDWREAGLRTACRLRMKLFTLDRALVVGRIGALSAGDRQRASAALRSTLGLD